jgi:holo-[acyl-carrier protein] synthase
MVGIDIVENARIEEGIKRFGERFLRKIYTEAEISYCDTYKDPIPCLAARWAAKEAVIKAYYPLFGKVLKFKQIEIRGKRGMPPSAEVKGEEGEIMRKAGYQLIVSIAHEKKFSVAIAQIVKTQEER